MDSTESARNGKPFNSTAKVQKMHTRKPLFTRTCSWCRFGSFKLWRKFNELFDFFPWRRLLANASFACTVGCPNNSRRLTKFKGAKRKQHFLVLHHADPSCCLCVRLVQIGRAHC